MVKRATPTKGEYPIDPAPRHVKDGVVKQITVPKIEHPMSSLDGYALIGVDTDPDSNLYGVLAGQHAAGLDVVAIIPVKFHGVRDGYLVITYDKKQDPRA